MKIKNIVTLIITLIGFAACSSESELLDIPVNGDLVSVTINLGSLQTKASVGLDTDEGHIENAVIGIFDSKGIPTVAPIVLGKGGKSEEIRLPLIKSNAYAFVNVSPEDKVALLAIGDEKTFKEYAITKQLSQVAGQLPKFGSEKGFIPQDGDKIQIEVHQLTARLDVAVKIMKENGQDITEQQPFLFTDPSVTWSNINDNNTGNVTNESGTFYTEIDKITYHVINRAYSYADANPVLQLSGKVNGKDCRYSYTFKDKLEADHVYVMLVKVTVKEDMTISLTYEIIVKETVEVTVPKFE